MNIDCHNFCSHSANESGYSLIVLEGWPFDGLFVSGLGRSGISPLKAMRDVQKLDATLKHTRSGGRGICSAQKGVAG